MDNKWIRAAVPALLIHCSIGTVYCWSTFKQAIAETIGMSTFAVGWAFSFAIFFLGMSAAFAGKLVERDIHKSSLVACICFTLGMLGTGLSIQYLTGKAALIAIYICYGCIMGIGLGVGYLTPVKTLMLWFPDNKGLATGISIMGFGLAKAIATPIMEVLQSKFGISAMFYILGIIYFGMMLLGHFLLKKPEGWIEPTNTSDFKVGSMFKNKTFIGIWLMFYINIHCGLALITYEKQILLNTFGAASVMIALIPSVTAAFNAGGRIGFSTLSDRFKDRNTIYAVIFAMSMAVTYICKGFNAIGNYGALVVLLLVVVNAGYGGGFSTLPALLSSRFGMKSVSTIHGLALSAWAIAGLTGNNMSELILSNGGDYNSILIVTGLLYLVAFILSNRLVREK